MSSVSGSAGRVGGAALRELDHDHRGGGRAQDERNQGQGPAALRASDQFVERFADDVRRPVLDRIHAYSEGRALLGRDISVAHLASELGSLRPRRSRRRFLRSTAVGARTEHGDDDSAVTAGRRRQPLVRRLGGRGGEAAGGRPRTGPDCGRGEGAAGALWRERARGQEEGVRLAGVPAPVPRLHADGPARRRGRQPDLHAGDRHDARAGRPDRLQRGAGHAPGGQGRGQPGRAPEDDEEHRPRAPRRRRRSRSTRAELVPGDIVLVEAGNRVPADGRLFVAATLEIEEAALTGESVASPKTTDADARAGRPARRPSLHGVHEHRGHPRPRRDDRDRHRDGHRDGPHRRPAQPDRGRQDAAAEAARPADR